MVNINKIYRNILIKNIQIQMYEFKLNWISNINNYKLI